MIHRRFRQAFSPADLEVAVAAAIAMPQLAAPEVRVPVVETAGAAVEVLLLGVVRMLASGGSAVLWSLGEAAVCAVVLPANLIIPGNGCSSI